MGKHPVLKPREVAIILKRLGFAELLNNEGHEVSLEVGPCTKLFRVSKPKRTDSSALSMRVEKTMLSQRIGFSLSSGQ